MGPLLVVLIFVFIGLVTSRADKAAQKKRVDEAYKGFDPPNALGGAKFADNAALRKAGLFKGRGVPIGYSPDGRHALHYDGKGHLLSIMSARIGKGLLLIAALLSWQQSAIIVDPKAENALVTANFRKRLGKVYILNPFKMFAGELGSMQARYNPMSVLDPSDISFHASCDKISAACIWDEGHAGGKYFSDNARVLESGVIAALKRHGAPELQNLVEVARVIGSGEGLFTFCRNAMQSNDPFIIQKLKRFALDPGKEPSREMNDVIATAYGGLSFVANAAIAESLSGSDYRFADLSKKTATVFICLPLATLDVTEKYFRLILESALSELLTEGAK